MKTSEKRIYRNPLGLEHFLPGAPWAIMHSSSLEPGQKEFRRICGKDYVFFKDADGSIHALPNTCPHWGAKLSEGTVHKKIVPHIRSGGLDNQASVSYAIQCPWHAVNFNKKAERFDDRLEKWVPCAEFEPLELIEQDGVIWTYAEFEPRIPIPTITTELDSKYQFLFETAQTYVDTSIEWLLKINHDYDHQNGTHGQSFKITKVLFDEWNESEDGLNTTARYRMPIQKPNLGDYINNPMLILLEDILSVELDNYFPSLVLFTPQTPIGVIKQLHIHYPIDKDKSYTSLLFWCEFNQPLLTPLYKKMIAAASKQVVDEDAGIFTEKVYSEKPHQFKLPNEHGVDYIDKMFKNWHT